MSDLVSRLRAACSPESPLGKLCSEAADALASLQEPFCVLFLDGRNEHGTHVLPSFPRSIELVEDDVVTQAEFILRHAEAQGFAVGDHVWAEFCKVLPQIGEYGRVELEGYWDFAGINETMTRALFSKQAAES